MSKGKFTKAVVGYCNNVFKKDAINCKAVGTTIHDDGNEEYGAVLIDSMIDFSEDYEAWVKRIQLMMDRWVATVAQGEHVVTIEAVTYGNNTMIVLFTACK